MYLCLHLKMGFVNLSKPKSYEAQAQHGHIVGEERIQADRISVEVTSFHHSDMTVDRLLKSTDLVKE